MYYAYTKTIIFANLDNATTVELFVCLLVCLFPSYCHPLGTKLNT